jgi:hypothetical protein
MGEKVGIDNLYSLFSILSFFKVIPFDCPTGTHDPRVLTVIRDKRLYFFYAGWCTLFLSAVFNGVQWFQFLDESLGETALNLIWFIGVSYCCILDWYLIRNREDLEGFIVRLQKYCKGYDGKIRNMSKIRL